MNYYRNTLSRSPNWVIDGLDNEKSAIRQKSIIQTNGV